ncbi:hypothetical protein ACF0H5_019740 [Mactra antiquata]
MDISKVNGNIAGSSMLKRNMSSPETAVNDNQACVKTETDDINQSDEDDDIPSEPLIKIKTEPEDEMETTVVVLNRHDKFNARRKPDASTLRQYCDKCDAGFKFPYQLARHKKIKHEGKYPYQCKVCDKPFVRISSLREHRFVHSDERPFGCSKCDKKFKMKGNLRKHMVDIHPEETRRPKLIFQCEYCSKIFKTKESLTSHFICHTSEKAFACDICEKKFNRKNNLNIHRLIHFPEKKFKCPDCPMRFNREYSLKIHARNHLAVKPYKCELCPSSFSQLHALKTHFRLHTGEKPFKCTVCPQSFRQLATLQVHLKRHSGVKDFKCNVCDRAFVIKRRLVEHMRIHTGEKPFSCEFCSYKAATSSGLRLHKKTHLRKMENSTSKTDAGSNGSMDGSSVKKRTRSNTKSKVNLKTVNSDEKLFADNVEDEDEEINGMEDDDKVVDETQVCDSTFEITTEYDIVVDIAENGVKIEPMDDQLEEKNDIEPLNNDNDINNSESYSNNIENNIGFKVSNIRSMADEYTAASEEMNTAIDETSENVNKKDGGQPDFKFLASEILHKHLNDLIPTVDAYILFGKIDCIVNELCNLNKRSTSVNSNHKNIGRKGKQNPKREVTSKRVYISKSLNSNSVDAIEKSDISKYTATTVRESVVKSPDAIPAYNEDTNKVVVKVEPDTSISDSFINEANQNMSEIQASHPTLSQSLLSFDNKNQLVPPTPNNVTLIPNFAPPTPLISTPTPHILTPTSMFDRHENVGNSNGSGSHNRSPFDESITSSLRKLLSNSAAKVKNSNSVTQSYSNGIGTPSSSGKSQILHDILSRPPQYLVASRNSVATLQHAQMLKQINESKTRVYDDNDDDDLGSKDFPWISIKHVKIEPLSDGEN